MKKIVCIVALIFVVATAGYVLAHPTNQDKLTVTVSYPTPKGEPIKVEYWTLHFGEATYSKMASGQSPRPFEIGTLTTPVTLKSGDKSLKAGKYGVRIKGGPDGVFSLQFSESGAAAAPAKKAEGEMGMKMMPPQAAPVMEVSMKPIDIPADSPHLQVSITPKAETAEMNVPNSVVFVFRYGKHTSEAEFTIES